MVAGWYSIGIVCSGAFLWYLVHYFVFISYACRDYVDWWTASLPGRPTLLLASSLFAITLALWLCADIIRPKPVRFPATLRIVQAMLTGSMVLMSVMQSGQLSPHSADGRVFTYVLEDATRWPVMSSLFAVSAVPFAYEAVDVDWDDPAFDRYRVLESQYQDTFGADLVPRHFGVHDGQLECEAEAGLAAEFERALAIYNMRRDAEMAEAEPTIWEIDRMAREDNKRASARFPQD